MSFRASTRVGVRLALLFVVALIAAPVAQDRWTQELDQPLDYVPGELLVKFVPGTPESVLNRALGEMRGRHLGTFERIGVHHWRSGHGVSTDQALAMLGRAPFRDYVEYAEPNYIRYATQTHPSDPLRGDLWALHNIGQTGGTLGADIGALPTWADQGAASPIVAVIDSGVDYKHPDLTANMWCSNSSVDCGSGVHGRDFVNGDDDPMDDNGHGTHVSGTIAAAGDDGKGVMGVSWRARIMALKFLNSGGSGTDANAILAINYAHANGATIINASWGGSTNSRSLMAAIRDCGCLFVAAAGNSGSSKTFYPAGYNLDNIISVAATDHNDKLASFSNYGSWVDLAAPGVNILSTYRGGGYATLSGTSMAAPHVTGVAALLAAKTLATKWQDQKAVILSTFDTPMGLTGKVPAGRLSAARAVGVERPKPESTKPADVTDLAVTALQVKMLQISWTAVGHDGLEPAYLNDLRYLREVEVTESNWATATPVLGEPLGPPGVLSYDLAGLDASTNYCFALRVWDASGNSSGLATKCATTMPGPKWEIETVAQGADIYFAGYYGLAFDPNGNALVAFREKVGRKSFLRFATRSNGSWAITTADIDGSGLDLVLDPSGNPAISHGWGALRFTVGTWTGSSWSWQSQLLETGPENDQTSLGFRNDLPCIAYWGGGGNPRLKFTQRQVDGTWLADIVDPNAEHFWVETSLAFDGSGNPAIAYGRVDATGSPTVLAFAHWNGSRWDLTDAESGVKGYGYAPSLAYDRAGNPAIVHSIPGAGVRYVWWNGSNWTGETVIISGSNASLAFDPSGLPVIAYSTSNDQKVWLARRGADGWSSELVDSNAWLGNRIALKFDDHGSPALLYTDLFMTHELRLARLVVPPQ